MWSKVLIIRSHLYNNLLARKKQYIRDKRSPIPKNENVSKVMSSNKAKDTKPELLLRRSLWANNIRGYRINYKQVAGKPDIAFISKKIAIFVNGCYWHRCPKCDYALPKHNTDFWKNKFERNIQRDIRKTAELEALGWHVITIWECEIKEDINEIVTIIAELLNQFGSK